MGRRVSTSPPSVPNAGCLDRDEDGVPFDRLGVFTARPATEDELYALLLSRGRRSENAEDCQNPGLSIAEGHAKFRLAAREARRKARPSGSVADEAFDRCCRP